MAMSYYCKRNRNTGRIGNKNHHFGLTVQSSSMEIDKATNMSTGRVQGVTFNVGDDILCFLTRKDFEQLQHAFRDRDGVRVIDKDGVRTTKARQNA